MAPDRDESDAELRAQGVGMHAVTDRETTSSKTCKYDENYIALGSCIDTGLFTEPQYVACANVGNYPTTWWARSKVVFCQ